MVRSSDFPNRYRNDLLASLPDDVTGAQRLIMRDQAVDDVCAMMRLDGHWPFDGRERAAPSRFPIVIASTQVAA